MSRRLGKRGQTGGMNPCPEKPKTAKITKITKTTTLMGTGNIHRRIYRGLLKCYMHSKVFNADLVGAYNVLLKTKTIPPSPTLRGVGVMRPRPCAELNPVFAGDVVLNLPRTLAL
ncbi:MAG: hypothetical protein QXX86_02215 [Sulfolobales archaeon]